MSTIPTAQMPHLLVGLQADGMANGLVETSALLHRSLGGRWSVVALEDASSARQASSRRTPLLQALDRAEQLGARIGRIHTGTYQPSDTVAALVHRARAEKATWLLIAAPQGQGRFGQDLRPGHFADHLAQSLPGVTVQVVAPAPALGSGAPSVVAAHPRRIGTAEAAAQFGVAALVVFACTLVAELLHALFHPGHLVMVYLLGVVYAAAKLGRAAALATVVGSIVIYDWLFVAPRWSLNPTDKTYWVVFAVMLVVGMVVSRLVAQAREKSETAEVRARQALALTELAAGLARARSDEDIATRLVESLNAALRCRSWVLLGHDGSLRPAGPPPPEGADAAQAAEVARHGQEAGPGTTRRPDLPLAYLPLAADATVLGVVLVEPADGRAASLEDTHLRRALVNQAAMALDRARHEARSAEAAVAAERERLRSTLLAGVSHDFRTPLTTIIGNATSLIEQGRQLTEPQRDALLADLLSQASRLHQLASNLLELTRLEEGAVQPSFEWCPADEFAEEAIEPVRRLLDHHRFELHVESGGLVWCDPRLLVQIVHNLIENAVRHTPAGGTIALWLLSTPEVCRLIVHDSGPGLPAGQESAVFGRFQRGDRAKADGGTGLGLALCRAIAQLHGGRIEAHNDGGACFTLTLPQPAQRPDEEIAA